METAQLKVPGVVITEDSNWIQELSKGYVSGSNSGSFLKLFNLSHVSGSLPKVHNPAMVSPLAIG